jgi:hypothetical protein
MPYIITVDTISQRWPNVCPFCESSVPSGAIERPYTRYTGFWGLIVTYVSCQYQTPACETCQARSRRLWLAGLSLTTLPWVFLLIAMFLVPVIVFSGPIPILVTSAATAAGIFVFVSRGAWLRRFRLSYLRDGRATFSARSETYAAALANVNGVPFKYALLTIWLN